MGAQIEWASKLEAMMIVADKEDIIVISNG